MKIINYYDEDYHEENHIITNTHIYSYIFSTKPKKKRFSDPVTTNKNIQNTLMVRKALLKKDMGSSLMTIEQDKYIESMAD